MLSALRFATGPKLKPEAVTETVASEPIEPPTTDEAPYAVAIQNMSLDELVQLRQATDAEIDRLDKAIPEQSARAREAFDHKDGASVQAAFQAEGEMTRRRAAEQERSRLLMVMLNERAGAEVYAARAELQQRIDKVNAQSADLLQSIIDALFALEKCVTMAEERGAAISSDVVGMSDKLQAGLREQCAGYVPGISVLQPRIEPLPQIARVVWGVEQLVERAKKLADGPRLGRWELPKRG